MSRQTDTAEERLFKAMSHPLRFRLLAKLNERAASPSVLARELDEPIGNVSYHVRVLADLGAAELVETRRVRGAVEHLYKATARPEFDDTHWARLPLSVRRQFQDETLQAIWEHLVEAAGRGGFDRNDAHVSWTTVELDERGYEEISRLLGDTLDRALEIHAEAAGRQVGRPPERQDLARTELVILHYDRPRPPEEERSRGGEARGGAAVPPDGASTPAG